MRAVFLALTILAAGRHQTATDFDFRLDFGMCTHDVVDTIQGNYVHDMGPSEPAISIVLTVPTATKQAILDAITVARFSEYSPMFQDKAGRMRLPANMYRLEVRRAGGQKNGVSWLDNVTPSSADADRLRKMFTTIIDLINHRSFELRCRIQLVSAFSELVASPKAYAAASPRRSMRSA